MNENNTCVKRLIHLPQWKASDLSSFVSAKIKDTCLVLYIEKHFHLLIERKAPKNFVILKNKNCLYVSFFIRAISYGSKSQRQPLPHFSFPLLFLHGRPSVGANRSHFAAPP
uniref:Uncharacterized protein n=1 Tax=Kalanchoe fedtschenkoi TaxID=63787 RepID=A0A7N0VF36_KALFE